MHSSIRIQAFQRYSSTNNQMLLKDAIMQYTTVWSYC